MSGAAVYARRCPAALGAGSQAGVALIEVCGDAGDVDSVLGLLGVGPVGVGSVLYARVLELDRCVVSRPSAGCLQLFLHAGRYVVESVERALCEGGVRKLGDLESVSAGDFDACLVDTLAHTASPLGVALLERQRGRFDAAGLLDDAGRVVRGATDAEYARSVRLNRLLMPATVVAVGRTNAGKSTLVNALAKRRVSVVSHEPGTTRDHVGVLIDVGALVVRWIDTPGLLDDAGRVGAVDESALARLGEVVGTADVLVRCVASDDERHSSLDRLGPWDGLFESVDGVPEIRCLTKADLSVPAWSPGWIHTAAADGTGLGELVAAVREALVPQSIVESDEPWWFHPMLSPVG